MKLILNTKSKTIGVVRNPFEKVVSDYYASLNYIGFDKWVVKETPEYQTLLYKDCDHIIRLEAWERDLKDLDLVPKDTSILESTKVVYDWRSWYTLKTRTMIAQLYHNDIITYGYTY
tara:strand:+ start:204 stop:554 length:351 start_codon:yes stop_codon:yes gene_type:complete